jgi:hypothetical protein
MLGISVWAFVSLSCTLANAKRRWVLARSGFGHASPRRRACAKIPMRFEDFSFGSIRIDGTTYEHDGPARISSLGCKLRETDKKLHGRDGYLVSELIRQLVQIRFGELTSEEAKGKAWDQKRLFNTAKFGTTENLLRFMAGTLRQGVSKLINLSPTLTEALLEIEGTIQKIHQIRD